MMHPLHAKVAFYVRLPWHWLGVTLHELWKKIVSKAHIANYREIMLVEHEGEPFVHFIRHSIVTATSTLSSQGQCGSGLHGGSTDICHMMITQAFCLARVRRLSCAMQASFVRSWCQGSQTPKRLGGGILQQWDSAATRPTKSSRLPSLFLHGRKMESPSTRSPF